MEASLTGCDRSSENFGCERCWPPAASAAWEARSALSHINELIDDSHFHVMVLGCSRCNQRFLSVFTEMIDWAHGDDSQYWALMPLTQAEVDDVLAQRELLTESRLETLGPGRRCLRLHHPTGSRPTTIWAKGMLVGPHD